MSMIPLLVTADDFGIHDAVNDAILDCIEHEAVNSVSIMTNGRSFNANLVNEISRKGVFTGVHVTWIGEQWLTEDVFLKDRKALFKRLVLEGKSFLSMLQNEAEEQVKVLSRCNVSISHIDSHQHVHHFPFLWEIVADLAQRHAVSRIRVAHANSPADIRRTFSGACLQLLARQRFNKDKHYFTVGLKHTGQYTINLLKEELQSNCGVKTELIVHPGKSNAAMSVHYGFWNFDWESEYAALISEEFKSCLADYGFFLSRKTER